MLPKQTQHSNHSLTTQALEEALQDRGLACRLRDREQAAVAAPPWVGGVCVLLGEVKCGMDKG